MGAVLGRADLQVRVEELDILVITSGLQPVRDLLFDLSGSLFAVPQSRIHAVTTIRTL
jgi:hypothetical protein